VGSAVGFTGRCGHREVSGGDLTASSEVPPSCCRSTDAGDGPGLVELGRQGTARSVVGISLPRLGCRLQSWDGGWDFYHVDDLADLALAWLSAGEA